MNPRNTRLHIYHLEQRLAETKAALAAVLAGQIDAVVDPTSNTPVLLAKAQDALRESEERYRLIVETANEGIWTVDNESRITFANRRVAMMLGLPNDEIVGQPLGRFLPEPGGVLRVARSSEGAPEEREVALVRGDGSELWVLLRTSPMRDPAGNIVGWLGMLTDRTNRRQAELALRTSEMRFRRLWDSGIILITITSLEGKILEINDAGLRMLGYSREELLAGHLGWDELTPAEWRSADDGARAQLASAGIASPWEKELVRKDGSHVSVLAAAAIIEGVEGVAIAIDLSDRKRAERHLLERMRIAALSAGVGLLLAQQDPLKTTLKKCAEAIVQHLDIAFARIWTVPAPETGALELQASAGLASDPEGPHERILIGELEIGRIAQQRCGFRTNDVKRDARRGDPVWEGITAFAGHPLLVNNVLVGVLAMFSRKPITDPMFAGLGAIADALAVGIERKLVTSTNAVLELQLRQSQKMEAIGRLAGGIAHDFNNILSVILSYGEFLLEELKPLDPARADAAEICKAATRAATLTRQLLMFSRQQILEPRVLELATVPTVLEGMLRRVLREDVQLILKSDSSHARVCVDPGSIEQVIMNLAVNARDAMPNGGKLTIETTTDLVGGMFAPDHHTGIKPGRYVVLAVTDTGTGMDAATQARIFEPFFTTKEVGKGTGLGMSTVFGIVEQSNGALRVRSEIEIGTTISVYLPQVDAELDRLHHSSSSVSRGSETILVVEDEEQVRAVACAILKRSGYRVIEMRSASEAQQFCQTHERQHIDLLLTDVVMPEISGPVLARSLIETRPDLRVLCMSGYFDDNTTHHNILQTDFALLQKPFTSDSLTRKIRELLDVASS